MGLSWSLALPVGRGSCRAVTSPWLSSIWRISRYHLSCRKPLHPSPLWRIPAPRFSPFRNPQSGSGCFCLLPSAFCIRFDMRPPSSHSPEPRIEHGLNTDAEVRADRSAAVGNAPAAAASQSKSLHPMCVRPYHPNSACEDGPQRRGNVDRGGFSPEKGGARPGTAPSVFTF